MFICLTPMSEENVGFPLEDVIEALKVEESCDGLITFGVGGERILYAISEDYYQLLRLGEKFDLPGAVVEYTPTLSSETTH